MRIGAIAFVVGALALAGCASENQPLAAGTTKTPPPTNYKASILENAKSSFFDPYSVRDASISKPFAVNRIGHGEVWFVCVRANAKNRMGGYTGLRPTTYAFRGDAILPSSSGASAYDEFNCQHAQYEPFPELENL